MLSVSRELDIFVEFVLIYVQVKEFAFNNADKCSVVLIVVDGNNYSACGTL